MKAFGKRGTTAPAIEARAPASCQMPAAELTLEDIMESPKPKDEFGKFLLIMGSGIIGLPVAAFALFVLFTVLQVFFYGTSAQQAEAEARSTFAQACELAAKQTLNFPGSYQYGRGSAGAYPVAGGWDVGLEFSATNAFGVPTDFAATCAYREAGKTFRLVSVRERL